VLLVHELGGGFGSGWATTGHFVLFNEKIITLSISIGSHIPCK
jgi:hypothetical protein